MEAVNRNLSGTGLASLNIKQSTIIVNLFVLIVFLQNPPWPLWDYWFPILFICFLMSSVLLYTRITTAKPINKSLFIFTCLLILFFVIFQSLQNFRTSSLVTIVIFYQLYFLSAEEKFKIINKITSVLAIIIAVSLPLWLINQYIFELPFGSDLTYGDWKGKNQTLVLENYYFFIQPKQQLINRFYSIFDEPGTLGTLSAFILFANKYNFKDKRNIIILAGAFFTYSFAFFVLTFVGLSLYFIRKPKLLIIYSILIAAIVLLTYNIIKSNPTFKATVSSRLTSTEASLKARTSKDVNIYFKKYISSGESIFGKGTGFLEKNPKLLAGQSFKFFMIENGFFGLMLVIGMYLFIYGENKFLMFSYLLLFLLSFLQRPFLFTPFQIIVYYAGISSLNYIPDSKYYKKLNGVSSQ